MSTFIKIACDQCHKELDVDSITQTSEMKTYSTMDGVRCTNTMSIIVISVGPSTQMKTR